MYGIRQVTFAREADLVKLQMRTAVAWARGRPSAASIEGSADARQRHTARGLAHFVELDFQDRNVEHDRGFDVSIQRDELSLGVSQARLESRSSLDAIAFLQLEHLAQARLEPRSSLAANIRALQNFE
jgi:hypothetical protein